jgi:4-amino-4-deoxy-L-arabinose transferase-like glycosyltransferase
MRRTLTLSGSCSLLFLLWLPTLRYPVVSDTAFYALLGESLWTHGRYELFDVPYAKHLPLHALLSYPLVSAFGFTAGMKLATLLAGMAVLLLTYLVLRESFSERIALIAVPLVAIHHGFVLMTMLGSADVLFTALFLLMVFSLLRAEDDTRWYVLAGLAIGLASLTRYNGVPLLAVYVFAILFWRREDMRSVWAYVGFFLGCTLFGLWLWRNFRVFGNPFHTTYTTELNAEAPDHLRQLWKNVLYYLNPLHNILPILLPAAVYGIITEWRKQQILLLAIACVLVLTAIWWVQAIRFAFPAYPILIGFSVVGFRKLFRSHPQYVRVGLPVLGVAIAAVHFGSLCLYTYGGCNSTFDRIIGIIPKDLGLSSEGFYTWGLARDSANAILPQNAIFAAGGPDHVRSYKEGFFRRDIRIVEASSAECPYYRITQSPREGEEILSVTGDYPLTYVTKISCPEIK